MRGRDPMKAAPEPVESGAAGKIAPASNGASRPTTGARRRVDTRGRQPGEGREGQDHGEDQAHCAKHPDAAVPHDRQTVRDVPARQAVEAVGQPIEMQAPGENLPQRHHEGGGEERRE